MGGVLRRVVEAAACVVAVGACSAVGNPPPEVAGTEAPRSTTTVTVVTEWSAPIVSVPPGPVLSPGDSIQAAVDEADEGTTLVIAEGVHRLQTIEPKDGQRFVGEPGAILSGARLLTDFFERDGMWVHSGIAAEGEQRGRCANEESTCRLPEDLFHDGERLRRVDSVDEVDADSWYLDYESETLYLGRDPSGAEVELSVLPFAFAGEASDVTIEGLVIEKYASPAQRGAIMNVRGWRIIGNEIRWNHGLGLYAGSDLLVSNNFFHHNGQFAIAGGGTNSVYEHNEIAYNHLGDFSFLWAAGGTKFVHTTGLVLRDNYVHDNAGPGLWLDGYNDDSRIEENRIADNLGSGIKLEISGGALVQDNVVTGNAFGNPNQWRGAGIMIRESGPVEVVGNRLEGNAEAVILHQDDDRENETGNRLHDVWVHGNEIVLDGLVGYFGDIPFDAMFDADLLFEDNNYTGSATTDSFLDHGRTVDFATWQERGRDLGSFLDET